MAKFGENGHYWKTDQKRSKFEKKVKNGQNWAGQNWLNLKQFPKWSQLKKMGEFSEIGFR